MERFIVRKKRKNELEEGLTTSGPLVLVTTSTDVNDITSSPQSGNSSEHTSKSSSRKSIVFNNNIISNDTSDSDLNSEKVNYDEANCTECVVANENNNIKFSVPRAFSRWQINYPWLSLNPVGKAICSICVEATNRSNKILLLSHFNTCVNSRRAFVEQGFNTWKNALKSFRSHEKSELHCSAIAVLGTLQQQSVIYCLSKTKKKEMIDARVALLKIFSTVKLLAKQGLSFRGKDDEYFNLVQILKMRAEDVPELNTWLNRTAYTWLYHDIINEIVELFANQVVRQNLEIIKSADFYAISLDETSDISRLEQVSICIRIALDNLTTMEFFMGFYSTENTKAQTLFDIVNDVHTPYDLKFSNLRGQCYDGASNVSGRITGLQARIRDVEPRAIYVHCTAHTLNLVVQDAIEHVSYARNFVGIVKDIINFIRDSPKRLAQFKNLQSGDSPSLTPFCPTR
ncbi:Zinc finger MYM-type protein 1 [Trachymyrmex cornetzi]|uniref:Zinc finger MYM-type protein 1 n=1 Tax=Trachymyrmex cornetzi TaxID=471704 RepID=A0A151JPA9_9HYME|nr:Zinc finger MYM-type protein 1 [Trachymyrmex cornetzi]